MADEQDYTPSASEVKKEDWMNSKWRPMMGWMYMLVCTMDFVGFPILWSLLQGLAHGNVSSQWQPLTLQGAGLFHIAMGAVIGISAYGRTQEKLGGAAGPTMSFPQGAGTTYVPPGQGNVNVSNQPGMGGGFGNGTTATPATGFGGGTPAFGAPSSGGFGNGTTATPATGFGGGTPAFGAPSSGGFGSPSSGFGSTPVTGGFGSNTGAGATTTGFGTAPAAAPVTGQVAAGFGGKLGPIPAQDPVI